MVDLPFIGWSLGVGIITSRGSPPTCRIDTTGATAIAEVYPMCGD